MKLEKYERTLINEISNASNYPINQVREILEYLYVYQLEHYLLNKPIPIPFLGNITIEYDKDEWINGLKKTVVTSTFNPSDLIRENIGNIEDGESKFLQDFYIDKVLSVLRDEVE